MEVLVEYLKDKQELGFHKIAFLLNRDDRTIWTIYHRVQKKRETLKPIKYKEKKTESGRIEISLSVFEDRTLSFFESLTEHLKDKLKLSFHEIASLLNRDDRTIWTLHNRAVKKREQDTQTKKQGVLGGGKK